MKTEYNFNKEFINILINYIDERKLYSLYKLNNDTKYTVDYLLDIVITLSTKNGYKYVLPHNIMNYLKFSHYGLCSKTSIKQFITKQIINIEDDGFLKTYLAIGHNYPIEIKELTVII